MARKRGKKYVEAAKLVDPDKAYAPEEAIELAKKSSYSKFDGTIEVHMRMGVDPRHADQQVRGVASLPNGLGKKVRVAVFAQGDAARAAEAAGADVRRPDLTARDARRGDGARSGELVEEGEQLRLLEPLAEFQPLHAVPHQRRDQRGGQHRGRREVRVVEQQRVVEPHDPHLAAARQ